jgi:hypothetical protein
MGWDAAGEKADSSGLKNARQNDKINGLGIARRNDKKFIHLGRWTAGGCPYMNRGGGGPSYGKLPSTSVIHPRLGRQLTFPTWHLISRKKQGESQTAV